MRRWFFFTSLLSTLTPVSRLRFINLDPAAVFVPVAFFFYIFNQVRPDTTFFVLAKFVIDSQWFFNTILDLQYVLYGLF